MKKNGLTLKQEKFCQLYASDREFFGNGVESYAEAYGLDLLKKKDYNTASVNASKLLTNTKILERINELLNLTLNDQFVDKQLSLLITQNAHPSTKLGAIKEYNKLKQRIEEKLDITSQGERITGFNYVKPTKDGENSNDKADS